VDFGYRRKVSGRAFASHGCRGCYVVFVAEAEAGVNKKFALILAAFMCGVLIDFVMGYFFQTAQLDFHGFLLAVVALSLCIFMLWRQGRLRKR
jgi:hypothetical protein